MMMDKAVYRDVYNLHEECINRLGEPDFWNSVFWPKADALSEHHKHDTFFMEMVIAVDHDLEKRWRNLKKQASQS